VVKGLQDCASCKSISYCGKEHQTEHFKDGHKLVCPGKAKPLPFAACVEGATQYYNAKMWASALPYYSALLVSECAAVVLFELILNCDIYKKEKIVKETNSCYFTTILSDHRNSSSEAVVSDCKWDYFLIIRVTLRDIFSLFQSPFTAYK
jgi:MYND finger